MDYLKKTLIIGMIFLLGACSLWPDSLTPQVFRIDVQQGNVIDNSMLSNLHPGMTKRQVRFALGTPVIVDVFHQDRWDYIYSLEPGGDTRRQARISLFFKDELLIRAEGDIQPEGNMLVMQELKEMPKVRVKEKEIGFFEYMKQTFAYGSDEE